MKKKFKHLVGSHEILQTYLQKFINVDLKKAQTGYMEFVKPIFKKFYQCDVAAIKKTDAMTMVFYVHCNNDQCRKTFKLSLDLTEFESNAEEKHTIMCQVHTSMPEKLCHCSPNGYQQLIPMTIEDYDEHSNVEQIPIVSASDQDEVEVQIAVNSIEAQLSDESRQILEDLVSSSNIEEEIFITIPQAHDEFPIETETPQDTIYDQGLTCAESSSSDMTLSATKTGSQDNSSLSNESQKDDSSGDLINSIKLKSIKSRLLQASTSEDQINTQEQATLTFPEIQKEGTPKKEEKTLKRKLPNATNEPRPKRSCRVKKNE